MTNSVNIVINNHGPQNLRIIPKYVPIEQKLGDVK